MKKISIVVPIYIADRDLFKMTLDLIRDVQTRTKGVIPELIIVNDCSPQDKLVGFLENKFSNGAKWIHNRKNVGFAHSVNMGIAHSSNDLILVLNNDVKIIDEYWLHNMITIMERENFDMTSPVGGWLDTNSDYVPVKNRNNNIKVSLHYLVGWALLLKRKVIDKIGLLPTDFGIGYWEDTLYSRIATQNNIKIGISPIAEDGQIAHFEHTTFKKIGIDLQEQYKKNQKIYKDIIYGKRKPNLPTVNDYLDQETYNDLINIGEK